MILLGSKIIFSGFDAHVAQEVEHLHGKQEVTGSSPVMGSILIRNTRESFLKGTNNLLLRRNRRWQKLNLKELSLT